MSTSAPLWRSLQPSGACSGVRLAWKEALGKAFPSLWPFLSPRRELAASFPCPYPGPDGCPRAVVCHANGEIVAVCRSNVAACERVALTKADLVVYSLDLDLLARVLREALGLEKRDAVLGMPRVRAVGGLTLAADLTVPVYLAMSWAPSELAVTVERLAIRASGPFVVMVPSANVLSAEVVRFLDGHQAVALALEDVTSAEDSGLAIFRERVLERVAPLRERLLREAFARELETWPGLAFFPTPEGASWEEVTIRFRDGHTVSVTVREAHAVLTYVQLGMAKRTDAVPTRQWQLLRAFAEARGVLDWSDPFASRENQKRRERLGADLKRFFRIAGDPIEATGNGWRCRFTVEPEEG